MNTKETTTETSTAWNGNFSDMKEFSDVVSTHEETVVQAPIFILFAEYMGYVSQFIKMAEDWCDGKVPAVHVQKFMMVEANSIFRQMKKDYDLDSIKYFYDSYYPLILKEYVDKLAEITKD